MKRIFPLIVILITVSVLGILYVQSQWIRNAIVVRKEQYEKDQKLAIVQIRQSLNQQFILKYFAETDEIPYWPEESSRQHFLAGHFSAQVFTVDEINAIIKDALTKNGVKQNFQFSITNIFNFSVIKSDGYNNVMNTEAEVIHLTNETAIRPETLFLYINQPKNFILAQMGGMILASILLTIIIIAAFALTLRTLFAQKKLSEIKSDFINNMTHELKTPLATISLAVDALNNKKVINDEDKIRYYSGMIKEENRRMNKQVETILQAARIERNDIQLNLQSIDAHQLIQQVANNSILPIQEKKGELLLNLHATKHTINVDEVHFSNIIFNLLDNAIKYSENTPKIIIETASHSGYLMIKITDNGIGMSKETQTRIFEKFYRAHTGNLHNVKGFGLGLSYVKALTEAHRGRIKVESSLGKGATFTLFFVLG